ncbi:MAG: HAMP domain-containing histidine kinase [Ruminococcaceae bacterium]|nr:HAMP domain-containing histidine kinase [Oscillospiraceae bacterium]
MKEIFLIAALFLAAAVCVVLITLHIISKKKVRALTQSIDKFIKDGTLTELATSDGDLAHLQTNICELEMRLIQEREYTKLEAKNNTEFISDISHQLKTPLAGLRLYCEMEHNTSPDCHTEKELALISKMEKLINNVLRLEKIRSDAYVMSFEETELSALLLDLKAEFASLFSQKDITVSGKSSLRCDKSWLREALGNVIKNACEHTKADGKVDILIEQAEKSVSVIIEDNGGGVAEDELSMLFRRFHRSQNASPDSAGIGLAITKAIVEKHHGTVTAENTEKGLRVSMCFPIIDANLKL